MSRHISLQSFNELLSQDKIAFLCGNGFSLNFDKDFVNIYDNLFTSHKSIIKNASYKIKSNSRFERKCKENYKSVFQYMRSFDEIELIRVFEDAVNFAESIISDAELIDKLKEEKKINELTFGISQIDIVSAICESNKSNGIKMVNIENWTTLIYMYFAIKELDYAGYEFNSNNSFITLLKMGNISRIKLDLEEDSLYEKVILNGFTTYYRFLFCTAILSNGKAINFDQLENVSNLKVHKIKSLLDQFEVFLTLNYDNIAENLYEKDIYHLHGEFVKDVDEYVFNQSLSLKSVNGYISFSDILIGDYFTFKTFLPIVNNFASSNKWNKKVVPFSEKLEKLIADYEIQSVVIFGMNIENDHHVLRNLMLSFYNNDQQDPHIIYCYYSEYERIQFQEAFQEVITFSKEVNEYSMTIRISYMSTKEILEEFFY